MHIHIYIYIYIYIYEDRRLIVLLSRVADTTPYVGGNLGGMSIVQYVKLPFVKRALFSSPPIRLKCE